MKKFILDIFYFIFKFSCIIFKNKETNYYLRENDNILILSCFRIGDSLFLTPAYRSLKEKFPHIQITVILNDRAAMEILKNNPHIDKIILINSYLKGVIYIIYNLFNKYDVVIDYSSTFFWSFIFRFLRANYRISRESKAGIGHFILKDFGWLYDKIVKYNGKYIVDYFLCIIKELGVETKKSNMEVYLTSLEIEATRKKFSNALKNKYIILHLGTKNEVNKWYKWHDLAKELLKENQKLNIVFTGSKSDIDIYDFCISNIDYRFKKRIKSLIGDTTIRELAVIIEGSKCFIGGDTGATHIAIALDKAVVMLFGRADYQLYCPTTEKVYPIISNIECYPCYTYNNICHVCTYQKSKCMDNLNVQEIVNKTNILVYKFE